MVDASMPELHGNKKQAREKISSNTRQRAFRIDPNFEHRMNDFGTKKIYQP